MLTDASLDAFNGQLMGTPTSAHISRVSKPSSRRNNNSKPKSSLSLVATTPTIAAKSTASNMIVDEDDFDSSFVVNHPVEEVNFGDLSQSKRKSQTKASRLSQASSLFEQSISASSTPKEVSSRRKASRTLHTNENTPPSVESPTVRPGSLRAKSKFVARLPSALGKSALGSVSFNGDMQKQRISVGGGIESEWQDEPRALVSLSSLFRCRLSAYISVSVLSDHSSDSDLVADPARIVAIHKWTVVSTSRKSSHSSRVAAQIITTKESR